MSFDFDPNAYESTATGGTWLDNGKHIVTVTQHELGEATNGTEFLLLTFEDADGKTHEERFYLGDTVLWRLATVFKAARFTSKIDLHASGMIKKALYKKPMEVVIAPNTNPNTGKTYRAIKYVNQLPEGTKMAERKGAEEPPPGDGAPPIDDDPIPF